jgi:AcrR family transcriptional regulator
VVAQTADPLTPARGRPRDVDVDQRILASAFRQLVRVGYAGLSIESVAAEAGVAKTTIYRRYPTKRDLVVAALRESTPFPAPQLDLPAHEALEGFVRTAIAMLVESGAFHVLGSLLVEDQRHPGLLDVFRERILFPRRAVMEAVIRSGVERGELRSDVDPLIVIEMIAGAVFAHHVILGLEGDEAWIRSLVDHVWSAIGSRQAA